MNDLIKVLQEQFCKELNDAWVEANQEQTGPNIDAFKFTKIFNLVKEAIEEGYTFLIEYDHVHFLTERIMNTDAENELFNLPEWKTLTPINNMLKECDEGKWKQLKPHLEELKNKSVRPILHSFVTDFAKGCGPFYTKGSNDTIYAFGSFGNIQLDMLLVTMICMIEKEVKI
jgi:hypothetical protein